MIYEYRTAMPCCTFNLPFDLLYSVWFNSSVSNHMSLCCPLFLFHLSFTPYMTHKVADKYDTNMHPSCSLARFVSLFYFNFLVWLFIGSEGLKKGLSVSAAVFWKSVWCRWSKRHSISVWQREWYSVSCLMFLAQSLVSSCSAWLLSN